MDEETSPPSKKRKIRQSSLLDLLPKKGWFVIQFAERSETAFFARQLQDVKPTYKNQSSWKSVLVYSPHYTGSCPNHIPQTSSSKTDHMSC